MSELRRNVRRALPWSFTAAALQILLSLVSMVLLVRYLDPKEYGIWALFGALPVTVNLVTSFGWVEFIIRFVPGLDDAGEVGRTVWPIVFRQMILAVAVSGLLVLGFDLYQARFGLEGYWLHLVVIQGAVIANRGTLYLTTAMNARFLQREVVLRTFPAQVLQLAVTALGIYWREDFLFFVILAACVAAGNLAAAAWVFGRQYPAPGLRKLAAGVDEDREQTSYRRLSFVNEWGVNFLSTDIARFIVSYFSDNVQVAIYAVATTIVSRLQFFLPIPMLKSVTGATFYTRYEQTGDPVELQRMFRFLYDTNSLVSLGLLVAFLTGGRELLAFVFHTTYGDAFTPVVILLAFLILHFMPLGMVVRALKRPESLIYSKVAVLLNVALGVPLVIHYGATGMAVATAVSVAFKNMVLLFFVRRLIAFRMPWRALSRGGLAAAAAVLVGRALDPWLPLLAEIALAGLVYVGAIRVLRPLEPADQVLLGEVAPGPIGRLVPWILGRPA
ncbi:MAG: polysaccharide biosynthesis C-terminal domain-containing protein [Deltaproteobacteria bacterium]|nr:polysaccharide biosynthesis C-terminal domain-containing protein [Deltaproteobacteria bacterium]